MRVERWILGSGVFFFIPVAIAYYLLSDGELVGTLALAMCGGLSAIIGGYLLVLSRRIGLRPEDRNDADMASGAGEIGFYSPHSWAPLVCAAGAALVFLSLAVGIWLAVPGAVVAVAGMIMWVTQYSEVDG